MSEFISQRELAKYFGVSQPYIAKLARSGVLDGCRKGGKLVRECAIHAIERYRAGNSRRGQHAGQTRGSVAAASQRSEGVNAADIPDEVKWTPVATSANVRELDALLAMVDDPNRRVQLMRDFWSAKLNEYKAKEQEGRLIPFDEVVRANQKIIKAFRDKALALPVKLAGVVLTATTQEEARSILDNAIYDLLEELTRELGAAADS